MHHVKPIINKRNGKQKQGRGFSLNELKAAGVNKQQAKIAGLPFDIRRRSEHNENVEAIKGHIKNKKVKT